MLMIALPVFFFAIYVPDGVIKVSCMAIYFLILERICSVASTVFMFGCADPNLSGIHLQPCLRSRTICMSAIRQNSLGGERCQLGQRSWTLLLHRKSKSLLIFRG